MSVPSRALMLFEEALWTPETVAKGEEDSGEAAKPKD
jgi:hypothetical protein